MVELNKLIKGKVKLNEDMSRHTSFRIGGTIDVWVEPQDIHDLREILKISRRYKKPIYIIGGGNNLLVNDRRINGIAIHLPASLFRDINVRGDCVIAGAGVSLKHLLSVCIEKGLAGLEFCSGIPGTLGGAVAMNAGFGPKDVDSNIGNFVNNVTVMDRGGRIKTIKKRNLHFSYRTSSMSKFIILEVELRLRKAKKDYVRRLCKIILEKKRKTQGPYKPSAGCIFRNPYNGFISAGKIIELAGLKAKRIGDAKVSEKNANYIINLSNAQFKDVKKLIYIIKKRIKEEFNIELELEVKIWE